MEEDHERYSILYDGMERVLYPGQDIAIGSSKRIDGAGNQRVEQGTFGNGEVFGRHKFRFRRLLPLLRRSPVCTDIRKAMQASQQGAAFA